MSFIFSSVSGIQFTRLGHICGDFKQPSLDARQLTLFSWDNYTEFPLWSVIKIIIIFLFVASNEVYEPEMLVWFVGATFFEFRTRHVIFWWCHRRLQTKLGTSILIISQLKIQILVFYLHQKHSKNLRTGIVHLYAKAVLLDVPAVKGCKLFVSWSFPIRCRDQRAVPYFQQFHYPLSMRYCQSLPKPWPQYHDSDKVKSHAIADCFLSDSLLFAIYGHLSAVFHIMWLVWLRRKM